MLNLRPYSFMLGMNSNLPTLYVGPSNGLNTTGEVGIGTINTNGFKLRVVGDVSFDRVSIGGEYIPRHDDPAKQHSVQVYLGGVKRILEFKIKFLKYVVYNLMIQK